MYEHGDISGINGGGGGVGGESGDGGDENNEEGAIKLEIVEDDELAENMMDDENENKESLKQILSDYRISRSQAQRMMEERVNESKVDELIRTGALGGDVAILEALPKDVENENTNGNKESPLQNEAKEEGGTTGKSGESNQNETHSEPKSNKPPEDGEGPKTVFVVKKEE